MTDETEPAAEDQPTTSSPTHQAGSLFVDRPRPLWSRLNRTNRIAALVLGGVGAVVVAALIFGAGLLVGAEYGNSEGHHDRDGTSDYESGERTSGEHGSHDGESADDGDRNGADEQGGSAVNEQSGSGASEQPATGERTAPPRP
jgi:hypothetical protein